MSIRRTAIALAAVLMTAVISAAAQQPAVQVDVDSARFQIRTTLRAFYFNLAHRDWEALAADILSAKVMASHPMPAALLSQSDRKAVPELQEDCPSDTAERVDHATITREGDWAGPRYPTVRRVERPTSSGWSASSAAGESFMSISGKSSALATGPLKSNGVRGTEPGTTYLPARRATRVDPMVALRAE